MDFCSSLGITAALYSRVFLVVSKMVLAADQKGFPLAIHGQGPARARFDLTRGRQMLSMALADAKMRRSDAVRREAD